METKAIYRDILERNRAREEATLCRFACPSAAAVRRDPLREKVPDWENIRSPFFHDADKILHSLAYTRYIDKTQVFYLFDNDHITHRVLHVQIVSKIARVIARCLRLNEDLVEAISLGHDIGHVPFGHDGEAILNDICVANGIGAFCHNAQSVRWMLELENRGKGLNLCLQTLDGMLCHNGERSTQTLAPQRDKTWDDFMGEYRQCLLDKEASKPLRPMTLEGCVMRVADVIAYIGRDIEDAITLKLLGREDLPEEATAVLGNTNSTIINALTLDLIENSCDRDAVCFSKRVFDALKALLRFNHDRIYGNPRAHVEPGKLRRLFDAVYEHCLASLTARDEGSSIARFYASCIQPRHLSEMSPARVAVDFISGMTDDFFLAEADRILMPRRFGTKAQ